jgi:hypothetical protein
MKDIKPKLVIVCKTYAGDMQSFRRLYISIMQHNSDRIPIYLSVPKIDELLFTSFVDPAVCNVVTDESYAEKYFTDQQYWGLSTGYINQEICKLSFWENQIAENYLFVDSDAYFIRDG